MKVRLISKTVGVSEEIEGKGPQDIVSYCARVSNPSNQDNFESAPRLLRFCMKHGHVSIFEMADFTFEITTSRAIAAQILRHRHFCFQEFSQRYAEATAYEPIELRLQDEKNKQNSLENTDPDLDVWFQESVSDLQKKTEALYKQALEYGVAKEQARFVLPLNVQTVLYMKGSLRSWIHYLALRMGQETQKEHREIANAIHDVLIKEAPDVMSTLKDYSIYQSNPYG
jgi:thymidylate synthase (FAD)